MIEENIYVVLLKEKVSQDFCSLQSLHLLIIWILFFLSTFPLETKQKSDIQCTFFTSPYYLMRFKKRVVKENTEQDQMGRGFHELRDLHSTQYGLFS